MNHDAAATVQPGSRRGGLRRYRCRDRHRHHRIHRFHPSATDARGIFFAGTNRDNVTLTLSGDCRNTPSAAATTTAPRASASNRRPSPPRGTAEAFIKSVTLVDANGKILCTLEQNTDTEEENIWTGTAELEKR